MAGPQGEKIEDDRRKENYFSTSAFDEPQFVTKRLPSIFLKKVSLSNGRRWLRSNHVQCLLIPCCYILFPRYTDLDLQKTEGIFLKSGLSSVFLIFFKYHCRFFLENITFLYLSAHLHFPYRLTININTNTVVRPLHKIIIRDSCKKIVCALL